MKWIRENNYEEEMDEVMQALKSVKCSGRFTRKAGQSIYYELFSSPHSKGWIVLSHGFTESIAKYGEVIWYLTQSGYSVAMLEHRGHGRSYRDVPELWLTNVDSFDDYRDDLIYFIKEILMPQLDGQPLYVLGHSMGGAIVAHVMEHAPELPVTKYILSCPMIAPQTGGLPTIAAKMISQANGIVGRGHKPIIGAQAYDPQEAFDEVNGCCTSHVRFDWYHKIQCKHSYFQNSACTYNWLREAIRQTDRVLDPSRVAMVQVPVLLIQAGKDNMVENEAQNQFASLLSDIQVHCFPDAKHEIFRGVDTEVHEYIEKILSFI